ncbi:tRNA (guanine(26)-N(2))-dimethyltransferase-like [Homarus americanus]|uniref:tRNA (guanine(26)-N(2))-dimethyltransferase n=1 Tax=Homarus americanus TaxID=6706 RepID=A0A8J5MPT0_HOMAM|nr:tRNA (guanine(26)-N(2))-dimethyltransferase-like [Homarus americanus]
MTLGPGDTLMDQRHLQLAQHTTLISGCKRSFILCSLVAWLMFVITRHRQAISQVRKFNLRRKMTSNDITEVDSSVQSDAGDDLGFVVDKRPFTSVTEGKAEVLFPSVAVLRVFAAQFKQQEKEKKKKQELQQKNQKETSEEGNTNNNGKELSLEDENSLLLPSGVKDENGICILEGLAASGLRSIRYAREVGGIKKIVANDISNQALECMKRNIDHNGVKDVVIPSHSDARQALRIVLQCIESHANRYGRHTVPLLSLSADFYVRVVVKIFTSKIRCKETFSKVSWLYQCVGCETQTLHPLGRVVVNGKSVKYQLSSGPPVASACSHCGHRHIVAGPIWSAPIHNVDFLKSVKASLVEDNFSTYRRMYGVLTMMEEELPHVPLYYVLDKLANVAGINPCKMIQFRSALLNAGYSVSMSHAGKGSIKTDAPSQVVWDIIRAWEKLHPANRAKMTDDRPGKRLLEKQIQTEINFELHPQANPESKKQELLRFQMKPERNWGPKVRAKTSLFHGDQEEKRSRNQGKKRKCQPGDKELPDKILKDEADTTVL